jgi:hypothetical protein
MSKKVYWVVTNDEDVAERWIEKRLQDQGFASQYIPLILSDISTIEHLGIKSLSPPQGVFLKGWENIPTIREIIIKLQTLSMNNNYTLNKILTMHTYMHNNATLKNPNGPYTLTAAKPPVYTPAFTPAVAGTVLTNTKDGSQFICHFSHLGRV